MTYSSLDSRSTSGMSILTLPDGATLRFKPSLQSPGDGFPTREIIDAQWRDEEGRHGCFHGTADAFVMWLWELSKP